MRRCRTGRTQTTQRCAVSWLLLLSIGARRTARKLPPGSLHIEFAGVHNHPVAKPQLLTGLKRLGARRSVRIESLPRKRIRRKKSEAADVPSRRRAQILRMVEDRHTNCVGPQRGFPIDIFGGTSADAGFAAKTLGVHGHATVLLVETGVQAYADDRVLMVLKCHRFTRRESEIDVVDVCIGTGAKRHAAVFSDQQLRLRAEPIGPEGEFTAIPSGLEASHVAKYDSPHSRALVRGIVLPEIDAAETFG